MTRKLYQAIASKVTARLNCIESDTPTEWEQRHEDDVEALVKEHLPSGGGFDAGTTIDFDRSTGDRLVFHTSYHHMSEHGYYDGWTEHDVITTASLAHGFSLKVTGRDRNDIKDYIADTFHLALLIDVE